ncbi:hypothetical protein FGG08_005068 [Glutinoglossum americanum]|uniref:Actin-like ATPase domain-containing protein n=1 Tax=Glutinoglossum americanum TaxID=1670608 RepID=A0A9P8KYW4_9PEZI|nr:hypothetical protein FGG08_005068 [Glutinoglossum americanum]
MASLPERQERRLVIAIDYGTTYTGVAIATPAGNKVYLNKIDIIRDWGPQMGNHDKIPSVISYSRASDAQEQQWGASLSPEAVAMVHTKLELDVHDTSEELDLISQALDGMYNLHFQYVKAAGGLPEYTWKGPEEIVEDYLTKVFDYLLEAVESFTEELRARIPVDIVVTIPAEWSYRAKNSTFRALSRAGFNKDTFPKLTEMLLVSEPEAAAIYTARYLKELHGADFLKKDECFALCDAGGGTVVRGAHLQEVTLRFNWCFKDVVSYKVKELQPTFELKAVTFATGSKCGSMFIDLAFKKWLRDLLGEKNYQQLDQTQLVHKISSHDTEGQQMRELMKEFNKLKRKFKKDHRDMKIDLPEPLHNLDMDNRVIGGEITITKFVTAYPFFHSLLMLTSDNMRSFFDPCVDRIVELIEGQIAQVARLQTRLKNIFLIGGFAESKYLREEIEYSLRLRNIQVRRPDTSWTAVVRGAAIFGIEKSTSKVLSAMSACPRSYGVSVSQSFSEIQHDDQDYFVDPLTKTPMAKEQLMWLIKKGDLILSDEPKVVKQWFTKIFSETGPREGKIPLYAYSEDDIPERTFDSQNELTVVHILEYDLTDVPLQEFTRQQPPGNSPPFYVASLRLIMRLDPQRLKIELCWNERTLCSAEMDST